MPRAMLIMDVRTMSSMLIRHAHRRMSLIPGRAVVLSHTKAHLSGIKRDLATVNWDAVKFDAYAGEDNQNLLKACKRSRIREVWPQFEEQIKEAREYIQRIHA